MNVPVLKTTLHSLTVGASAKGAAVYFTTPKGPLGTAPKGLADALGHIRHTGDAGDTSLLSFGKGPVLAVGLGDKTTLADLRKAGGALARALMDAKLAQASVHVPSVKGLKAADVLHHLLTAVQATSYRIDDFSTKPEKDRAPYLTLGIVPPAGVTDAVAKQVIATVDGITKAVNLSRRAIDLPPNVLTTAALRDMALALAKEFPRSVKVTVFDRTALTKMGCNTLLAVARGSAQEPFIVQVDYTGAKGKSRVDLVGKGLVYDTGGLDLKTGGHMAGMKGDMAGAATVLGIVRAAATLGLKVNLRGTLGIVENAIGPNAVRPDEVVKAYNGTFIEVTDTDAEGRLVLYDCLSLVRDQGATTVVDFATLTGSIVRALGTRFAGLFCDDVRLKNGLLAAAKDTGEGLWAMPLADAEAYRDEQKSKVADLRNYVPGGPPDAIMAGLFLRHAVTTPKVGTKGKTPSPAYAHVDIAGTSDSAPDITGKDTPKSLSTGYGIRTVLTWLTA
jgi:leucyl aminopeptidase